MPWSERDRMSLRQEFVGLAAQQGCYFAELCRRYQISRKTGYKWIERARQGRPLDDLSRKPKKSPGRTDSQMEQRIVELREKHPVWGARKLRKILERRGCKTCLQ
jgi:transposase